MDRLRDLIVRYQEGVTQEHEDAILVELLRDDPEARALLRRLARQQAGLVRLHRGSAPAPALDDDRAALVDLVVRYQEDAVEEEEARYLAACLAEDRGARRLFARLARQHAQLFRLHREARPASGIHPIPRRPSHRRRATSDRVRRHSGRRVQADRASPEMAGRWSGPALLIAALVVIGATLAGAWHVARAVPEPAEPNALLARVVASSGVITVRDRAGVLQQRSILFEGDRIEVAGDGHAVVDFAAEETSLRLYPGSALELARAGHARAGKLWSLARGKLYVDAAPQLHGHPLVITTPSARLIVKGTAFFLHSGERDTRVLVRHGTVAVADDDGAVERDVTAGQQAVVEESSPEPVVEPWLELAEGEPTELVLLYDFESGAVGPGDHAEIVDPTAAPGDAHARASRYRHPHTGRVTQAVRVQNGEDEADRGPGLFRSTGTEVLRFAYAADDDRHALRVWIKDWPDPAKYEHPLEREVEPIADGRWHTVEIPLREMLRPRTPEPWNRVARGAWITQLVFEMPPDGAFRVDDVLVVRDRSEPRETLWRQPFDDDELGSHEQGQIVPDRDDPPHHVRSVDLRDPTTGEPATGVYLGDPEGIAVVGEGGRREALHLRYRTDRGGACHVISPALEPHDHDRRHLMVHTVTLEGDGAWHELNIPLADFHSAATGDPGFPDGWLVEGFFFKRPRGQAFELDDLVLDRALLDPHRRPLRR